jgi:hypothetical protein
MPALEVVAEKLAENFSNALAARKINRAVVTREFGK